MIEKAVVLYFDPEQIGESEGAKCGSCMMYVGETKYRGHCTVVAGAISGQHGVCGLYVHGEHMGPDMKGMIPKSIAGYISEGAPTHCGNCEYFLPALRRCRIVDGVIAFHGCCNAWEEKK